MPMNTLPHTACGSPPAPHPTSGLLGERGLQLVNRFQHGMPICDRPYAAMAKALAWNEAELIETLGDLAGRGMVSRVGPVFEHSQAGASSLVAMKVPTHRLEHVAAQVSGHPEVNHNYEREHAWNLWFVVTAPSQSGIDAVLARIERDSGIRPLALPMLRAFHIDLGFPLAAASDGRLTVGPRLPDGADPGGGRTVAMPPLAPTTRPLTQEQRDRLRAAIERGLPLAPRPYQALADQTGADESALIAQVRAWQDGGLFRRYGIVVRHHVLGISANLMLVMDVDDEGVGRLGERLAEEPGVTLCYWRQRHLPEWRYNLYCMIHGHERQGVLTRARRLLSDHGLDGCAHQYLFSVRAFKQRGARYTAAAQDPTC